MFKRFDTVSIKKDRIQFLNLYYSIDLTDLVGIVELQPNNKSYCYVQFITQGKSHSLLINHIDLQIDNRRQKQPEELYQPDFISTSTIGGDDLTKFKLVK